MMKNWRRGRGRESCGGGLEDGLDDVQLSGLGALMRYCTVARVGLPRQLGACEYANLPNAEYILTLFVREI